MLCCGGRKERVPDIADAGANAGDHRESDGLPLPDRDRSAAAPNDLPWWKREVQWHVTDIAHPSPTPPFLIT